MMRSDRVKRRLAVAGLMVICALAILAIGLAAFASNWQPSGGTLLDRTKADEILVPKPHGNANWLPDAWTHGRVLEPTARELVQRAYLDAWDELSRPDRPGLADAVSSFGAGARTQAKTIAGVATASVVSHAHKIQLTFYSDDGSVIGLHDAEADVRYGLPTSDGVVEMQDVAQYDVVLLLGDDATWRITSWRRVAATGGTYFVAAPPQVSPWPLRLKVIAFVLLVVALLALRREHRRRRGPGSGYVRRRTRLRRRLRVLRPGSRRRARREQQGSARWPDPSPADLDQTRSPMGT
jgi:hypothetical protein